MKEFGQQYGENYAQLHNGNEMLIPKNENGAIDVL